MSLATFVTYTITIFFATVIPGPGMCLAFAHGLQYGKIKSCSSALGSMTASVFQALTSFLITYTVLAASGAIFDTLQLVGAVYLGYLGWKIYGTQLDFEVEKLASEGATSLWNLFRQGFFISILNPKAIFFFTALFPQFAKMSEITVASSALLLAPIAILSFGGFMLYVILGNGISYLIKNSKFGQNINKIIGLFFITLGILSASMLILASN